MFQDLSKHIQKYPYIFLPHTFKSKKGRVKNKTKETNKQKKTPWCCTKREITISHYIT